MAAWRVDVTIALTCLAGCGRCGFDRVDLTADAAGDAPATDGPPDAPLGRFGMPTKISVSTGASEDDPTLTADLLELIFESDRPGGSGGGDLWIARRTAVDEPWSTPVPVPTVNSSGSEEHPGLSADGLTLWFSSNRPGGLGSFDIYVSTRADRDPDTPWSPPILATALNDAGNNESPQVDASGLVMVMATGPDGNEDLFVSTRATLGSTWPAPSPIAELTQAGSSETAAMLSQDRRRLYFTSNRTGVSELYTADRSTQTGAFDPPIPITELDFAGEQTDPWISPDQRTIVFVSTEDGTRDLYEATR